MMVRCNRCGRIWDYTGSCYKIGCNRCGTSVPAKLGHKRYLESIGETEPVETGDAV